MTVAKGKYDDLCTRIREETGAAVAMVLKETTCKFCGRWLVRLNDNETVNLNSHASVMYRRVDSTTTTMITDLATAKCMLFKCKIRRWWNKITH